MIGDKVGSDPDSDSDQVTPPALPYPLPDAHPHPASVDDGIPVGAAAYGLPALAATGPGLVVGGVGTGKTGYLHNLVIGRALCSDAVTWVIDLEGGGVSAPVLFPWANGMAPRPVIDWVATTGAEATLMFAALLRVVHARIVAYQRRLIAADGTYLRVTPDIPNLTLIVDGPVPLIWDWAQSINMINRLGRAYGVSVVTSLTAEPGALLADGDVYGFATVAMFRHRWTYGYALFGPGHHKMVRLEDLTQTGDGYLLTPEVRRRTPTRFRSYLATSHRIRAIVTRRDVQEWQATLDQPSAFAAGDAYDGRWSRDAIVVFVNSLVT